MSTKEKKVKWIGIIIATVIIVIAGIGIGVYRSDANQLQRHLNLGQKYLDELNYEQAIVEFDRAIQIDPKCVDAYLEMAEAYKIMGNDSGTVLTAEEGYRNGLEVYERLWESAGENVQASESLGIYLREYIDILFDKEQYEEIRALVEKYGSWATGVDFAQILAKIESAEMIKVSIQMTDIRADNVYNAEGYGFLTIYEDETDLPQKAMIDGNGMFVLPYLSTDLRYYISDGIVSLTANYVYGWEEDTVAYYRLDGSAIFEPEYVTNYWVDETNGITHETWEETFRWSGTPMRDGYALAVRWDGIRSHSSGGESGPIKGLWGGGYHIHSYIIDENGVIVCTLPEEFNKGVGGEHLFYYELGWCGEGLFGVFRYKEDDFTYEALGYMDPMGNMVIDLAERRFMNLWPFQGGLAAVLSENDKVGFIDKAGILVIPCEYEDFGGFGEDGLCAVEKGGKWGYIDRGNQEIIPFEYEDFSGFSEDGLCAVKKNGKWGYIDRNNQEIIPFEYDDAYGAGDGLASVVKDGKCGLIDYKNRVIVDLEYDDISSFEGGTAYAIKDGVLYVIRQ